MQWRRRQRSAIDTQGYRVERHRYSGVQGGAPYILRGTERCAAYILWGSDRSVIGIGTVWSVIDTKGFRVELHMYLQRPQTMLYNTGHIGYGA